jgi:hypothetical protein
VNAARRDAELKEVLSALVAKCPRLRRSCYWAGAAAISLEELHHRGSFDLDFHTHRALVDVRPILAEIQQAFPGSFELISGPDEFGSGFTGVLRLPGLDGVALEVLSNFEDVPSRHLVPSSSAPKIRRITVERFLEDKIQCIAERAEARDLADVMAVLQRYPELGPAARRAVQAQDALVLAERLAGWGETSIRDDLVTYPDVDPREALQARDLLLGWLREQGRS